MTSTVTIPAGMIFGPDCGVAEQRYDSIDQSEATGSTQARLRGHPRWALTLMPPQRLKRAEAAYWRAVTLKLKGRVNVLAGYDPARTAPLGTMRGTITLNANVAAGAETMVLNAGAGQAGTTLRAGDWLQIGTGYGTSQLIMVTDDATGDGSGIITINFAHPLRKAYTAGAAITWDKPVAYFRQTQDRTAWRYKGQSLLEEGYGLAEMLEDWPT